MGQGLDSPRAWGVVAAAFAAMFVAFGIAYSYGAFLDEMREDFGVGRAAGAAFFSLTSLLYFGLGGVSGAAGDRFGQRRVLLVGAARSASASSPPRAPESLGVALAAYGIGVGVGVACAYVPMVALVGAWFERRRTLALGVAVAGIGIGTLVIPPVTAALIEAIGWRDSYLVLAAVGVAALGLCALAAAPAPAAGAPPGARSPTRCATASTGRSTSRPRCSACRCSSPSCTCPPTPRSVGSTRCSRPAWSARSGPPASSAGSRSARSPAPLGLLRVFRGCFIAIALSFVLWWVAGGSYPVLLAFAVVLGVGYGGYVALAPAVVAARFGVERLGALLGVLYTSAASARRSARRRRVRSSTPAATSPRSPPRSRSGSPLRSSRHAERGQTRPLVRGGEERP